MNKLKYVLGPMRVPFLVLAPACVVLGLGTAIWTSGPIDVLHFVLALIGAILAHISVNVFNEYFDFKNELDARTRRTPFSGGSGTLQERPDMARTALGTAIATTALTGLIGLYFVFVSGAALLPLGILGLLVAFIYTPWLARFPLLCLIAPGLGFGPLMVMGTDFVLTGEYSWTAFFASLVPFFLVNDLLLLNQFPDIEADRSVGRRNLPIVLGRKTSSLVYGAFLLLTYLSIVLGVVLRFLPAMSLIGLATLLIAVPASLGAYRFADQVDRLIPSQGINVILNLATPILVAVGLLIA